jgi:DNA mismatch repair protein MutL
LLGEDVFIMPIRQLAPDVAAKIAAGEVVERPASVVKELIENSIDAKATQIRVDLTHGGLQLIRVADNGNGIAADELPLALARHATSKVERIDDLEHIRSLGFRGEALASIASVAEVTVLSRQRNANQGAQIGASNGQLSEITTAASPEGTTITVRNLFNAVPARLKFLKSRNTEVSHCHHLLEQYALAYPEIRFSVFSDNRQIFATPGDGQLSSVLVEVYGLQVTDQMIPVKSSAQSNDTEHPIVSGYVSRPTCYKSTRQHISFFVNRRWVLSRMLTASLEGAYHSLLLTGRHPIAVINIQIDPTLLDVNVHPAKTEIRFLKDRLVFATILRAVRTTLLEEPEMPAWQPRSPQVQATVAKDEDDALADLQLEESQTLPEDINDAPASADTEDKPATHFPQDNPWLTVTEEESGTQPPLMSRLWQSHVHKTQDMDANPLNAMHMPTKNTTKDAIKGAKKAPARDNTDTLSTAFPSDAVETSLKASHGNEHSAIANGQITTPEQEKTDADALSWHILQDKLPAGGSIDPHQERRLPQLRVIGQLSQSYIVTEGDNGMYLIDQHAAHERILLERMVAALKTRTPLSQLLLTPLEIELAPNELEAIEEHIPQLETIGFALAIEENLQLAVNAVPSVLVKQMNAHSLHELLLDMTAPESLGHTETWEEQALANVACKAAIKANYFLTVSEMREMIEQLEQTRAPYSCCHGRPTMVHFSLPALAHEFERR